MEFNTFYNKIQTDESMMETIQHGNSEYPFQLYYDDLALFDFHCVEWHWHVEFEFVFVQEGTATFWVGEKQFSLGQGTGIFINSKILHRYFSEGDCAKFRSETDISRSGRQPDLQKIHCTDTGV